MKSQKDRQPAVAGQFYPSNANVLKNTVDSFLKQAKPRKNNAIAVVTPHAGYVFSGQVATDAINQINPDKKYENVFVIGISHHKAFDGASVWNAGDYLIPDAKIKVNTELAQKLIDQSPYFTCDCQAHEIEHSVEVQLPILYYHLKHDFQIVPILIGTQDTAILHKVAEVLRPYFNENNVFVFSTDFSHYPDYKSAILADRHTVEGLTSNDPDKFLKALKDNANASYPGLVTSACGAGDLLVLLYLTQKNKENYDYQIISYKNSGDSPYGGKDNVVGYYAVSVSLKKQKFELTDEDKEKLLKISRKTLEEYIKNGKIPTIDSSELTENIKKEAGAFVTLTKNGQLRGCIGRFMPQQPLWQVVQDMTIAAATQDSRFPPVTAAEVDKIDIEISVLTPLQKINTPEEIQVGRDGIYIKKGFRSGTLLPQVAVENHWDRMQFIEYCSKYKAGLGEDGWKDADLFIYQAIVFDEKEFP